MLQFKLPQRARTMEGPDEDYEDLALIMDYVEAKANEETPLPPPPVQQIIHTPACDQVLGIHELVETILLHLPLRRLARSRTVCQQWNYVMDVSHQIQQALWLKPVGTVRVAAAPHPPMGDPAYRFERHLEGRHIWKPVEGGVLAHRAIINPFLNEHIFGRDFPDWRQGAFSTRIPDYPYEPDSLIKKMLVFHPPVVAVELECSDCGLLSNICPKQAGRDGAIRTEDVGEGIFKHNITCPAWKTAQWEEEVYGYAGAKDLDFVGEDAGASPVHDEDIVDKITGYEMVAELKRRAELVPGSKPIHKPDA